MGGQTGAIRFVYNRRCVSDRTGIGCGISSCSTNLPVHLCRAIVQLHIVLSGPAICDGRAFCSNSLCLPINFLIARRFAFCCGCRVARRALIFCFSLSTCIREIRTTRCSVANRFPNAKGICFSHICILQLHVGCGKTIPLMDYGKFVSLL